MSGKLDKNELDRILGPFYTLSDVSDHLDVSTDDVQQMLAAGELLGLNTSDGQILLPSRQFGPGRELPTGLSQVLIALGMENDRVGAMIWLLSPSRSNFAGSAPVELLLGGKLDEVLQVAKRIGVSLKQ